MKEIIKTFFKYKWQLLLVLILLIIGSYCTLSLPEYTSNIVNIGISNSGIENIVPIKIRESEYTELLNNIDKNDQDTLNKHYKYIEKDKTYELKKITNDEKKHLENILTYPLFIRANKDKNI